MLAEITMTEKLLAFATPLAVIAQILISKHRGEKSAEKQQEIHDLVNGAMLRQLRVAAQLSRRIAFLTKDPADQLLADEAMQTYVDQERVVEDAAIRTENKGN